MGAGRRVYLWCVEDDRGKSGGHFGVEADLDTGLDLVLALHQQVQQLLRVHHRLTEVGHQADQRCVPLVHNLSTKRGTALFINFKLFILSTLCYFWVFSYFAQQ